MDHDMMTNEELVVCVLERNDDAFRELERRFSRFISLQMRKFYDVDGFTREDMLQEARIALYRACTTFDSGRNIRFATYFSTCLYTHFRRVMVDRNIKKPDPLRGCCEYDEETMSLQENRSLRYCTEKAVLTRERHSALMNAVETDLSRTERNVVKEYLKGSSYGAIAAKFRLTEKAVDNALSRAKNKLRLSLAEYR